MRRACLAVLLTLPAARVAAQDPPSIPLTTDTAQYCAQLAQQITERHSSRPEVARLLADGRGMCEQGVVRSGLRRLRRALVILDHDRDRPSQADPRRDMSADPMPH